MLLIGMLCAFSVLLTLHAAVVLSIVMCRLTNAMELWLQLTCAANDLDLNIESAQCMLMSQPLSVTPLMTANGKLLIY